MSECNVILGSFAHNSKAYMVTLFVSIAFNITIVYRTT